MCGVCVSKNLQADFFCQKNVTVPSEWHCMQAENVVEKRDNQGSKKLRQKTFNITT
jgi:hypothetical protein